MPALAGPWPQPGPGLKRRGTANPPISFTFNVSALHLSLDQILRPASLDGNGRPALADWTEASRNALKADEQHLVDRCLAGDAAAWEAILHQHARRIYNLCYRFTGRVEDAQDLSQEASLRIYRNLASFRANEGSLGTWILSLTRNLLIDHYRRHKYDRLTDSLDSAPAGADESDRPPELASRETRPQEAGLWRREVREQLGAALQRLSPELREAVILRDLQDLDYKEIAAVLRVPEGTVKSRINRGRIELARLLRPRLRGQTAEQGGGQS